MSLFPGSQHWMEGQTKDGVTLERRRVLQLSAGAAAALMIGWSARGVTQEVRQLSARAAPHDGAVTWETLLARAVPMASSLVQSENPQEEDYLLKLAALIVQMREPPDANFDVETDVASVYSYIRLPLMVMQFKLAAYAAIPYHDHRDYNGVLRVIDGELCVRSFEIVDGESVSAGSNETLMIRETRNETLHSGAISTLSRSRDNIHDLRAGEGGARLIDFFTFFRPDGRSVSLKVAPTRQWSNGLYEATWVE